MAATSTSLLARLSSGTDPGAWQQLVAVYGPLLDNWLARDGIQADDRDDILQDVLLYASQSLSQFQHNGRTGAFRCWLRKVLANRLQQFWQRRAREPLGTGDSNFLEQAKQLEDPDSGIARMWNEEHDRYVAGRLLAMARPHFEHNTWTAFERVVIESQPPQQVAKDLGISVNAVFIAKSRVLRHLRQNGRGLVE